MTLYDLRKQDGRTAREIIDAAKRLEPTFPSEPASLSAIEQRGTRDYWYLKALAAVYAIDLNSLAAIARPGKARRFLRYAERKNSAKCEISS